MVVGPKDWPVGAVCWGEVSHRVCTISPHRTKAASTLISFSMSFRRRGPNFGDVVGMEMIEPDAECGGVRSPKGYI